MDVDAENEIENKALLTRRREDLRAAKLAEAPGSRHLAGQPDRDAAHAGQSAPGVIVLTSDSCQSVGCEG